MGDQHKHFDSEFYYSGQLTDEDLLSLRKPWEKVRMPQSPPDNLLLNMY